MSDKKLLSIDALFGNRGSITVRSADVKDARLAIQWGEGSTSEFPLIMLRDCCPCEKCHSPTVNSRLTLFEQMMNNSTEIKAVNQSAEEVIIEWSDGHLSKYGSTWLYNRRLEKFAMDERLKSMYTDVMDTPWASSDLSQIISKATYEEITTTPEGVVKLTECMIKDGIFLIEGAPDEDCLVEFLKSIHAIHSSTHYGQKQWGVQNDPNSKALPNSSKKLELHIDMPYMAKPCQLQMLHCQIQAKDGGENKFSDALRAALTLKEQHPEDYKILSTVEVDFQFIKNYEDSPWFICNRAPIICEEPRTGLPTLCRFAAEVRCSQFNQPIEIVEQWFKSFRKFWQILESTSVLNKSKPGDIVAFNNGRIMHAREAYDKSQARKLEGVYAEWDYLMSAWRVAKTRIAQREQ